MTTAEAVPTPAAASESPRAVPSAASAGRARVTLARPLRERDLEDIIRWLSEGSPAAALTSDVRENVTMDSLRRALSEGLQVRLVRTRDEESVGLVTWRSRGHQRAYEVAVLIGDPLLWSTGIGAEAAMLAVDLLFMTFDAERVGVMTGSYNPYTSPALARAGFTLEGRLRHFYYVDGEYHDAIVWAMLREQHRAVIEASAGTPLAYRPSIDPAAVSRGRVACRRLLADPRIPRSWAEPLVPDALESAEEAG